MASNEFVGMTERANRIENETIGKIVPELRLVAGQYRSTPATIDDLVELTLRKAVADPDGCPPNMPLSLWLRGIMNRLVLH